MIHVAIGTKAEYIKTAPVLRELARREAPYRIIDIGQHGGLPRAFREPLGIDEPVVRLGRGRDAETILEVIGWMLGVARLLLRRRRQLRREVFGDEVGVCLVHGDTPSTLLATLLARRAGYPVHHLESGLRSYRLLQPFPEEISRILVMRLAAVLYAPNQEAADNLAEMNVRGDVVLTPGNTAVDAVFHAVSGDTNSSRGPGVIAVHRVENLHSKARVEAFLELLRLAAVSGAARFLVHPPTERALKSQGRWDDVLACGTTVEPLVPHSEFMRACANAAWVVTDGGSIQEECTVLGVPTLLWRAHTERPDGLDTCVVMSNYDLDIVRSFFADPESLRVEAGRRTGMSPAGIVVDDLVNRESA